MKNLIDQGLDIGIDWYYEEGDEKMMEDGEDLAEAVELEFNFIEIEDWNRGISVLFSFVQQCSETDKLMQSEFIVFVVIINLSES